MATRLSRVDPSKNMARFYELDVQSGLFGDVCVTRHWGRIGTNGQGKEHWFDSDAKGFELASNLERQKRRRGYTGSVPSPICSIRITEYFEFGKAVVTLPFRQDSLYQSYD